MTRPLLDADYSAIEARIVAWLAGQEDALEEYRQGVDRYKRMAAFVYGIPEEEVNKFPQRFVGKGLILGAGFGLGATKFRDSCKKPPGNYELPVGLEYKAIKSWRKKHKKIVDFWDEIDSAAKAAVLHKGKVFTAGKFISFRCITTGGIEFLLMRLPSGRELAYPMPRIVPGKFEGTTAVSFYQNLKGVVWGHNKGIWGGVWTENCLGGNTKVLSKQRGRINLHDVGTADLIWDGVEFVHHGGLAPKGVQRVIDCHGVLATPDHRFLMGENWLSAQTACTLPIEMLYSPHGYPSSLATPQSAESEIWKSHRRSEGARQWEEDNMDVPMHLWAPGGEDRLRLEEEESAGGGVWASVPGYEGIGGGAEHHAWDDESPRLLGVAQHVSAMLQPEAPSVEELRGSRDLGVRSVGGVLREFLVRHGADLPAWLGHRPGRQRWGLHPTKLPLDKTDQKLSKQEEHFAAGRSTTRFLGRGFEGRREEIDTLLPAERWADMGSNSQHPGESSQHVYDILNCGPRQRFAVQAHDGRLLIAHNCVQAVAADIMCHGAQNAEDAGYEICALIHDQALAYWQEGQTPEEFVSLLTDLPVWATGLPIAAEGSLVPFYRKD